MRRPFPPRVPFCRQTGSVGLLRHELKNPLSGILGMSALLLDGGLTGERRQLLLALRASALQLNRLIDRLLPGAPGTGRLPAGEAPRVNGLQVLEQAVWAHWQAAHRKGLELHLVWQPGLAEVWRVDPCGLRQALDNLVGNAVKFTRAGHVVLQARRVPAAGQGAGLIELRVSDTGIGVAAAADRRIYRVGEQGSEEISSHYGGSGIGLFVSEQFACGLGGRIDHARTAGNGAVFTLRLPIAADPAARVGRPGSGLLRRLRCLVSLESPAAEALASALRGLGTRVTRGRMPPAQAVERGFDACFCDLSALPAHTGSAGAQAAQAQSVICWVDATGSRGQRGEPSLKCVPLPRPLLRSNLEPLLLQVALEARMARA